MLFSEGRNEQTCTLEKQNNLSMTKWHNTGGPTPQAESLLSTYI